MARVVTASDERLSIQMGRIRIEILAPRADTPKITITIESGNAESQEERSDGVPVQETQLPVEPSNSRVIIFRM